MPASSAGPLEVDGVSVTAETSESYVNAVSQKLQETGLLDKDGEMLGEITESKALQMQKLKEAAQGRSW